MQGDHGDLQSWLSTVPRLRQNQDLLRYSHTTLTGQVHTRGLPRCNSAATISPMSDDVSSPSIAGGPAICEHPDWRLNATSHQGTAQRFSIPSTNMNAGSPGHQCTTETSMEKADTNELLDAERIEMTNKPGISCSASRL